MALCCLHERALLPPQHPPPLFQNFMLHVQYMYILQTTRIHNKQSKKKRNYILVYDYTQKMVNEKYILVEKRKLYIHN